MHVGSTLSYSVTINDEVARRISKISLDFGGLQKTVWNRYGLHLSLETRDAQGSHPVDVDAWSGDLDCVHAAGTQILSSPPQPSSTSTESETTQTGRSSPALNTPPDAPGKLEIFRLGQTNVEEQQPRKPNATHANLDWRSRRRRRRLTAPTPNHLQRVLDAIGHSGRQLDYLDTSGPTAAHGLHQPSSLTQSLPRLARRQLTWIALPSHHHYLLLLFLLLLLLLLLLLPQHLQMWHVWNELPQRLDSLPFANAAATAANENGCVENSLGHNRVEGAGRPRSRTPPPTTSSPGRAACKKPK
ncbi:hypothetical protein SprV_1002868300 [Sparganum proliferum]